MIGAHVIGWALRTPLGSTVEEVATRVLAKDRVDGRLAKIAIAPSMSSRHARFLGRLPLLALEAAHEAAGSAGVTGGERLGVFVGVGGLRVEWGELAPVLAAQRDDGASAWALGLDRIHPFWMLRHLSNNAQALLAADLDARGEGGTFGGATSGANAITAATRALAAGTIDTAVVVAYDTLIGPEVLVDHGLIPGEGAAALILTRRDGRALAHVAAASAADGERGQPREATVARVAARVCERKPIALDGPITGAPSAIGDLGAAMALVQTIVIGEHLRRGVVPGPVALCLSTGAPGLAAAVRVEAGT